MISELTKNKILKELVEPCYYSDVKEMMNERKIWRKTGNIFESLSKILVGCSSIISFAAGIYDYQLLLFASGTTCVMSLVAMQYSSYSFKESKDRTMELNKLLEEMNIENIIDISDDTDSGSSKPTSESKNKLLAKLSSLSDKDKVVVK